MNFAQSLLAESLAESLTVPASHLPPRIGPKQLLLLVSAHSCYLHLLTMNVAKYKLSNGMQLPVIGFGCDQLRQPEKRIREALDTGYRLFDSAVMYGNETEVGSAIAKWLKEDPSRKREHVMYQTKLLDSQQGLERARKEIDASLRKVKALEYIDIFLIHSPQTNRDRRLGTYQALQEAVDSGKVKAIGVSNYGVHHLKELLEWDGLKYKPVVNQVELNPWLQRQDIVKFCKENDIHLEAYSPLTQANLLDEGSISQLGNKYKLTPAQVLIKWSVQNGFTPLPRSSTPKRIGENFGAVTSADMSAEDVQSLGDPEAYEYFDWDPTKYRG